MTNLPAFIRAIHANPKDSLPWLVLSDYLEENGDEKTAKKIRHSLDFHGGTADHAQGYGVATGPHATLRDHYAGLGILANAEEPRAMNQQILLPHPTWSQLIASKSPKHLGVLAEHMRDAGHDHAAEVLERALTEPGGHVKVSHDNDPMTQTSERFVMPPNVVVKGIGGHRWPAVQMMVNELGGHTVIASVPAKLTDTHKIEQRGRRYSGVLEGPIHMLTTQTPHAFPDPKIE